MIFMIGLDSRDPLIRLMGEYTTVAGFKNIPEAVAIGWHPDVIVLDEVDGLGPDYMPELLAAFPEVPVIGATTLQDTAQRFLAGGASDIIMIGLMDPEEEIALLLKYDSA